MTAIAADRLKVSNDHLDLSVSPTGAKILKLRCRNHGREWLDSRQEAQPAARTESPDGYGAADAAGWDECFPTVLTCESVPAWLGMRDHGDLWGRRWTVDEAGPSLVRMNYLGPDGRYRFTRELTLAGPTLACSYLVEAREPFDFLWSMHPVLALTAADRLDLPDGETRVTAGQGHFAETTSETIRRRLSGAVAELDGRSVLKAYISPNDPTWTAGLTGSDGCSLHFTTTGPAQGLHLGVYLNLGGWPEPGSGLWHVALEPTTAPSDDIASAQRDGHAWTVSPERPARWSIRVRVDGELATDGARS